MVVGKAAAVEGESASWRFRSGVNSHRLATAIFVAPPFFAARASIIDTPGPRRSNGKGSSAMASTAFASTVTPVSAGGIELWPPGGSEEDKSEIQALMSISFAGFGLKKKKS